ncbi:MAG: hypothetical protein NTW66_04195 [Candidatus Magasanikbacteria bacterium]|nr:hypothetical protein [Candidatus Magasanikbacteria bacterium]
MKKSIAIIIVTVMFSGLFSSAAFADDPLSGVEVTITFNEPKTDNTATTIRTDKQADITACVRASAENRRLDYGSPAARAKIAAERNQRNSTIR